MGFDINCGVRLIRTNLSIEDVEPVKEQLTQSLFDHIPVGVGSKGVVPITAADLNDVLVKIFKTDPVLLIQQALLYVVAIYTIVPLDLPQLPCDACSLWCERSKVIVPSYAPPPPPPSCCCLRLDVVTAVPDPVLVHSAVVYSADRAIRTL